MSSNLQPLTITKSVRKSDGGRVMLAFDRNGKLHYHASLYLVARRDESHNTRAVRARSIKQLENIIVLLDWDDFLDRVMFGSGPTVEELKLLDRLFCYEGEEMAKLACAKLHREANGIPLSLGDGNFAETIIRSLREHRLRKATEKQYKDNLIHYLKWLMEEGNAILSHEDRFLFPPSERKIRLEAKEKITQHIIRPRKTKPRASKYAMMELDVLNKFFSSDPDYHAITPRHPLTAIRNKAMFMLQYHGGLRMGEVLSLKLEDIREPSGYFRYGEITIADRRDDRSDRRINQPHAKTGARVVDLKDDAAWDAVRAWRDAREFEIMQSLRDAGRMLGDEDHGYFFITTDGKPVAISTYKFAFSTTAKHIGFPHTASTHALRHLSAINYSKLIQQENLLKDNQVNWDHVSKSLRQRFGWSVTSNMPNYYTTTQLAQVAINDLRKDNF